MSSSECAYEMSVMSHTNGSSVFFEFIGVLALIPFDWHGDELMGVPLIVAASVRVCRGKVAGRTDGLMDFG